MKKNEDFNFVIGSALYGMQQRLTNYSKAKPITTFTQIQENDYVYYTGKLPFKLLKVQFTKTPTQEDGTYLGYRSVFLNNHTINVFSTRNHFLHCTGKEF